MSGIEGGQMVNVLFSLLDIVFVAGAITLLGAFLYARGKSSDPLRLKK